MPELPEVETIKNELTPYVVGHRIRDITLNWEKAVRQPSVNEFRSRIIGQEIKSINRRGKYLIFKLSSGDSLVIHLRLTGSLIVGKDSSEAPQYTRTIFHLNDGINIFFRDPRKFGKMHVVRDPESVVGKLGPDALDKDFTVEDLAQRLEKHKVPIKALLVDQNFVAGIGNMYADEALFAAKIYPLRQANSLSKEEIENLYHAIRRILIAAIGRKGASVQNYYRPDGTKGTAHFEFKVAHRGGELCPRCGTTIQRIVVRGRGSYFCPKCQSL